jgi:hypothetical protein
MLRRAHRFLPLRLPAVVVAVCFIVVSAGCSRSTRDGGAASGPDLMVNNFKAGNSYELWLNDEPVLFHATRSTEYWAGWPLVTGKNRAEIRVRALAATSNETRIELILRDGAEPRVVLAVTGATDAAGRSLEKAFAVVGTPTSTTRARAVADGDDAQARRVALALADAFASLDDTRVGAILDLPPDAIARNWPEWIASRRGQAEHGLRATAVRHADDLTSLVGRHYILARPSDAFIAHAPAPALVRITPPEGGGVDVLEFSQFIFFRDEHGSLWLRAHAVPTATRIKE